MRVGELGEFALIRVLRDLLPAAGPDVLVGIGDDVAVLDLGAGERGKVWLATCDVQVEGSHFLREAIDPRDLGHKALAVNLSDVAAAGGIPRFALVSLGLPKGLDVAFVEGLYQGIREEAERFGVQVVGGNLSGVRDNLFIDVFLLGEAPRDEVLLRSGARPGDRILVTGSLGDAAAGVLLLGLLPEWSAPPSSGPKDTETYPVSLEYARRAERRRDRPEPRVREGRVIAASRLATAMIDVSDGLAGDLGHLLQRSGVSARIEAARLPVAPENRDLACRLTEDEWHFALHGGEDYELLFTCPAASAEVLSHQVQEATGTPVSDIGEVLQAGSPGGLLLPDGRLLELGRGWDHFG